MHENLSLHNVLVNNHNGAFVIMTIVVIIFMDIFYSALLFGCTLIKFYMKLKQKSLVIVIIKILVDT